MIDAPTLTLGEIRQEVERITRQKHRSDLVAIFGRGEAEAFELNGRPWSVVPTRCELDLRERLPGAGDDVSARRVYLVDWATDVLPLDIYCRLAGGRLYHVARDARLATLFGARQVEGGLMGTPLAKLWLVGAVPPPRKIQGLLLTRELAWRRLLELKPGLPETALSSVGTLLAWAIGNDAGPAFARQAEGDDLWRATRRDLHGWIETTLGKPAVVVWRAWELGEADRLLEVLPLLVAARRAGDAFVAGQLAGQLSAWLHELAPIVRSCEVALSDDAVISAALPTEPPARIATLERSQALADAAGLGAVTLQSTWLPGGHTARERALALAVSAWLGQRSATNAGAVVGALSELEAHSLDELRRAKDHRSARTNLARLVLWLTSRPVPGPEGTRWQPAVELARTYAEEGGYVEWARQELRGLRGADERLLEAARNLELAVAAAMREYHRAFAEAYVCWIDAGKPSAAALPIEEVGAQVIAPFLQGHPRRKLLVVLMDGMSQAAATQLLSRLSDARRWRRIAWRTPGWHGALPLPPVLAVAPTLTEVSRSAFFAGKAIAAFGDEASAKDVGRWRDHRALSKLLGDGSAPLFMRHDIVAGHDLAEDVRSAIKGDSRLVAVVVNAIDEDLKGSVQVAKDYSRAPVLPLEALLSGAEESERAVLLIADHGHVLGDGTQVIAGRLTGGRPGGPRWRALAEGESAAAEEVLLPPTSWAPAGWSRVAALWDTSVVNRSAHYGEHGGLSLSETVAPMMLIGPDWLEHAIGDDPELGVRPQLDPDWWTLRVRRATAPAAQAPAVKPVQQTLSLVATPAAQAPRGPPSLVQALRRSPVFAVQIQGHPPPDVEQALTWLGVLIEAGGTMPAADFAAATGVRPHQVGGVVARMGLLNADGFAMVEFDHVGRRVVVHRARLVQHYGVKD